ARSPRPSGPRNRALITPVPTLMIATARFAASIVPESVNTNRSVRDTSGKTGIGIKLDRVPTAPQRSPEFPRGRLSPTHRRRQTRSIDNEPRVRPPAPSGVRLLDSLAHIRALTGVPANRPPECRIHSSWRYGPQFPDGPE